MYIPPKLTKREIEIIPLLVSGATRSDMAKHFKLSEETIKLHVRKILRKFDATSLRDCIFEITQYYEQFIQGGHSFFIPHLSSTAHVWGNQACRDIETEFDIVAINQNVDEISESYAANAPIEGVWINGALIAPQTELYGTKFTWTFPETLAPYQRTHISTRARFVSGTPENIENHYNKIVDPTGHFSFGVVFHSDNVPDTVHFSAMRSIGGEIPIERIFRPSPQEFRIEISRPEYLRRYRIRWVWNAQMC